MLYFRINKLARTVAFLALIWATYAVLEHGLGLGFATGCTIISGAWYAMTLESRRRLFDAYSDVVSRIRIVVPIVLGLFLSCLALSVPDTWQGWLPAGLLTVGWIGVYVRYWRNRRRYQRLGRGDVPKGTAIDPDPRSLRPLMAILTTGNAANLFHEPVSHAEVVLRNPETGELECLSSYFRCGVIFSALAKICHIYSKPGKHYIALAPLEELTDQDIDNAYWVAKRMQRENEDYKRRATAHRDRILNHLPMPSSLREWLRAHMQITGYSFLGLFIGRRASDHWTCIGSVIELYHRCGIRTGIYGEGFFGLGTGIGDPIDPTKLLKDKAFRILTEDEVAEALRIAA